MATQIMTTEQLLKGVEVENQILKAQIGAMYKELENKDVQIQKLNMQLEERKLVIDSILARITKKD